MTNVRYLSPSLAPNEQARELEEAAHARRFVFTSEGAVLDLAGDATVGDAAEEVARQAWRESGVRQRIVAAKVLSGLDKLTTQ